MRSWMRSVWLACALALACGQQTLAETYPNHSVVMVSPYSAGGGADLIARLFSQELTKRMGKSFVVENRLGAGGVIAANSVAKSKPDGYTLFMATSTQLAIQVTLHKHLDYDPATDFQPIALVAGVPFVLVVNPSLPVYSVADLIKLAKEKPGQLTFGSSGVGGPPHLYTQLLMSMTGIKMVHIPYKGTSQAVNDLLSGTIPIIFCDLAPAVPLIKAGKMRALGISSAERFGTLPDVPPVGDTVKGFDASAWIMLVAPKGTPKPIVDKLHDAVADIVKQPETHEKFQKLGVLPINSPPPEALKPFMSSEIKRWGDVVRAAGIAGTQ